MWPAGAAKKKYNFTDTQTRLVNLILAQIDVMAETSYPDEILKTAILCMRKYHLKFDECLKESNIRVDDGFLFLCGEKAGRVASKMPKGRSSGPDYEGRILARDEYYNACYYE